jgi:predicted ABC-type ATPase
MYVVAGPNGAGKSTLTRGARDGFGVDPIDPDAIQRETGSGSSEAWYAALRQCRDAIGAKRTFLVETTLAGSDAARLPTYLRLMVEAKASGYRLDFTFIALGNADAHVARVADRVRAGLHGIPEEKIRERYERSWRNATTALAIVDHALILDNSSIEVPFRLIAEIERGDVVALADDVPTWVASMLMGLELIKRFEAATGHEKPEL